MSGHIHELIEEAVRKHMEKHAANLETMCEVMLQRGDHGIMETIWDDGSYRMEISPDVPYGEHRVWHKTGPRE